MQASRVSQMMFCAAVFLAVACSDKDPLSSAGETTPASKLVTSRYAVGGLRNVGIGDVRKSIIVRGGPIHMANGIFFDAQDRLHIASVLGGEITVMDRDSGRVIKRLRSEVGVEGPDDVTVAADGSIYWTDLITGEVGRLSPDGSTSKQFIAPGVNPITFSDDGRLFVALALFGDAFYEIDPNLQEPPRLIAENLGGLNAFDFGPDGKLYGPLVSLGQIARIDIETGAIEILVEGLSFNTAVKFNSQGQLYSNNNPGVGEILRVDIEAGTTEKIAELPFGTDNLAFDSDDRLFVSNSVEGAIHEVMADGSVRTVREGGLVFPAGVAVMDDGSGGETVFVGNFNHVSRFDGRSGEKMGINVVSTYTVAVAGDHIISTNAPPGLVQTWDPATGAIGETLTGFALPTNAIAFGDDIAVAELGSNSVVLASDRSVLATGIGVPVGLAEDGGDLWVGDWASGTVWKIAVAGQILANPIAVATGLSFPEGLAVDSDGSLLIVETGTQRLLRLDASTGRLSTVADELALGAPTVKGFFPHGMFNGVAVGSSGAIYVTGDIDNVVYRLDR